MRQIGVTVPGGQEHFTLRTRDGQLAHSHRLLQCLQHGQKDGGMLTEMANCVHAFTLFVAK